MNGTRMVRSAVPLMALVLAIVSAPAPAAARLAVTASVKTNGGPLNVRSGPSVVDAQVGTLAHGTGVSVTCQIWGQLITGTTGRTAVWNRLTTGGFVADSYVYWRPSRPWIQWCAQPPTAPAIGRVKLSTGSLNVRSGPGTQFGIVGQVAANMSITATCQMWGSAVSGPASYSLLWHRLAAGRYVSNAYIGWSPTPPRLPFCGQEGVAVPPGSVERFISWAVGPAKESKRVYRVPTSVTIAQGIMESGVGRSGLNRFDHNYFGMKCFGTPGPVALGCRAYATTECSNGSCYRTSANFRAYRNAYGSFTDHGRQLATLARYQTAMRFTHDPNRFAVEIHKAGYATSPSYSTNLISVMRKYNLYRYDR